MKTRFIFSICLSLLLSSIFAPIMTNAMDIHLMVNSLDIAPVIATTITFISAFIPLSPAGSLMLYINTTVLRPGTNKGVGGDKKNMIVVFDWDEVASGYTRDDKGIVITGPLVMKAGCYMIEVYGTIEKLEGGAKSDGSTDNKAIKQSYKLSHPGDEQEILEFRYNWLNKNIGIIDRKCSSAKMLLYGSPCAPLQLTFDYKNSNDSNFTEFTLESVIKGPDIAIYEGTLTLETVTDTVAADAVDVDLTNGAGRYQLTDGTTVPAALATISNAVDGLVFTLLGSGGAHPSTIAAGTTFLLRNGTAWTALSNSTITFKVFKDGATTYKAIEVSRS